jgi:hypothetical protein
MRRVSVLLLLLAFAVPAVAAPTVQAKPGVSKAKKLAKCKRKAAKIKNKAKRKRAIRRCTRKYGSKRRPVAQKLPVTPPGAPAAPALSEGGIGDATVVAILDGGINPYHFDFLASKMPQALNANPGDDLPLNRPATEWLPGLTGSNPGFASFDPIQLSLSGDPAEQAVALNEGDKKLTGLKASAPGNLHGYWIPGTKVIGALTYADSGDLWQGVDAHGVGTTSSAVGNLHGTCPECLLFFVDYGDTPEEGEAAINWVMRQPWIDAISNSYGYSIAVRDRIYSGSSVELQRDATLRGQSIFFSAGNGQAGAFDAPNTTEFSSQEGPDWIVTVGAVSPGLDNYYDAGPTQDNDEGHGAYSGAGKPADIAGIGSDYPTAYTANEIGATGTSGFGGTSNATPEITGLYARALYRARTKLAGVSRTQDAGVIATGAPLACAAARAGCELGDGRLTGQELRRRLFEGAVHSPAGFAVYTAGAGPTPTTPAVGEEEFMAEGYGSYAGREQHDRNVWELEFDRMFAPLEGRAEALDRPEGEREWFVVDSYCRQQEWGAWSGGDYVEGQTDLPPDDPAWPTRTERKNTCLGGSLP